MELTRDDERARRICSLAPSFMNAREPVPSSSVAHDHYPELSPDSFRRAFSRDRDMLASCGIILRGTRGDTGETLWEADPERSFAGGAQLSATEAAALEVVCSPLADDSSFPLSNDLRLALAKIARVFSETSVAWGGAAQRPSRVLSTLRSCLVSQRAAHVTYVDAQGRRTERLIAPYGFFSLRQCLYLVAGRLDEKSSRAEGGTRVYRLDRFESAREAGGTSFETPQDFSIEDWRRLPFQIGDAPFRALFKIPPDRERDVRRAVSTQGTWEREGASLLLSVEARDVLEAARWAVALGVSPLEPPALVAAWRDLLEGVVSRVG